MKSLIARQGLKGQVLNITVWVLIDATTYLNRLVVKKERVGKKTIKQLIDKDYGVDFSKLFDLVFDTS